MNQSRKTTVAIIVVGVMLMLIGLDFSALENSKWLLFVAGLLMFSQGIFNGCLSKKD